MATPTLEESLPPKTLYHSLCNILYAAGCHRQDRWRLQACCAKRRSPHAARVAGGVVLLLPAVRGLRGWPQNGYASRNPSHCDMLGGVVGGWCGGCTRGMGGMVRRVHSRHSCMHALFTNMDGAQYDQGQKALRAGLCLVPKSLDKEGDGCS